MVYLDLYTFIYGITHWLLVDFLGTILNWLTLDGIAGWLAQGDVLNVVTIIIIGVIVLAIGFIIALTFIWVELKQLGRLMDSRGIQVGPLGYFANIATGVKTLLKEIIIPEAADEQVYNVAPVVIIGTSVFLFAFIPYSQGFLLSNSPLSVILTFAIFSIAPFAVMLGGWASNNKYTLIGGMRAAAQLISYEIPLLLTVVSVIILTGSFNFLDIVAYQQDHVWLAIPLFIGFVVFIVAIIAELERIPFDIPEAEAELVEGWGTEYGGLRFGLMMFSEYIRSFVGAAIAVLLFLGGWAGPFGDIIPEELWFLLKVFLVFAVFVWLRGSLPRVRTDQILSIGWKRLLPLAAVNIIVAMIWKIWGGF
jgi:NADH-quinone oxidoreductase subunit H